MSGVWKRVTAETFVLCGLTALLVTLALTNSASAIHRRSRVAYGAVAGYDAVAYDRSSAVAPRTGYNPVGFGFGGYNYGGYPLYGYAQYLPAAYDGYGAVGYVPAMAVGLPGGYGSGGYTANLAFGVAPTPFDAAYAPADMGEHCPADVVLSRRAYRRYLRHVCGAMAKLNWVFLPMPLPLLDCYEEFLGDETGIEEVEGIREGEPTAEELQPQSETNDQPPAGDAPGEETLSIDSLEPETLEAPASGDDGPSLESSGERSL